MSSVQKVLSHALKMAEQITIEEGLEVPNIYTIVLLKNENLVREKLLVDEGVYVDIVSEIVYIAPGTIDNIIYRFLAGYFLLATYKTFEKLDRHRALLLARKHFFKVFVYSVGES